MAVERPTLRNVYLYLVCLITLVVSLFAAVSLVRAVVSVAYPDPYNYGYGYYAPMDPAMEDVDPAEIERQQQIAEDGARRQALLDVVSSATTLLIAGPLYVYHWRRVQKELPGGIGTAPSAQAGPYPPTGPYAPTAPPAPPA
jgi:hypothetical protein